MSEYIVHSIPGSPFGRAVLATMEEKGASYRLAPGAHRSPEHLARHPFGRVPVLEHGQVSVSTKHKRILRYLDRAVARTPPPRTISRPGARMVFSWMNVNDWYLFQGVGAVIGFQRVVGPWLMGPTPDEMRKRDRGRHGEGAHGVQELARLLREQRYFTPATPFRWPICCSRRKSNSSR